ncbi:MAG: alanine--glyoxylate aminotransferase family protein [Gammaproteobacteria bacterium]|nr:alanine--glyoxylate aminotransferase family protein [Gammaproteobacteria bacterium]MDP7419218.1 alanine--glyoxylate aminotransferase family protein [Gammaproteobacteria bacterium]MDP7660806.1 alanine--glyoxylate aminotransferase family protein [Gammaproteobacteria bacterium]HJP39610.1 alanine--glyoxylate aminotransferase family protein [Gammaproteobacteria bacterium]
MPESFLPPQRRLMGPGPSDVPERVLTALARPTIGHLDPDFIAMMDELKGLLQFAFHTSNTLTLPVSAPGSAGMETCFVNLINPGDTVIVAQNGVFGGRMRDNVERCGAQAVLIEDEWGQPVDPNKVEDALHAHPEATALAFVHAETSTGARSDAQTLCALATHHDCLSIVDTVTSLGGIKVDVDGWGADAVYSGTQKCLSCVPGISPVTFSKRAAEHISNRDHAAQSWFLDLDLVMGYWGDSEQRTYHHTAPVNALYALHEALLILQEEGLENAWQRHASHHHALAAGLEALGMSFVVAPDWRLPQLNSVRIPDGLDDATVRNRLLDEYNLEIGAGLGPLAGQVWRIGLMGHSCRQDNVLLCLNALGKIITEADTTIDASCGIQAAKNVYAAT